MDSNQPDVPDVPELKTLYRVLDHVFNNAASSLFPAPTLAEVTGLNLEPSFNAQISNAQSSNAQSPNAQSSNAQTAPAQTAPAPCRQDGPVRNRDVGEGVKRCDKYFKKLDDKMRKDWSEHLLKRRCKVFMYLVNPDQTQTPPPTPTPTPQTLDMARRAAQE